MMPIAQEMKREDPLQVLEGCIATGVIFRRGPSSDLVSGTSESICGDENVYNIKRSTCSVIEVLGDRESRFDRWSLK